MGINISIAGVKRQHREASDTEVPDISDSTHRTDCDLDILGSFLIAV